MLSRHHQGLINAFREKQIRSQKRRGSRRNCVQATMISTDKFLDERKNTEESLNRATPIGPKIQVGALK
jgi:hypothetical protein